MVGQWLANGWPMVGPMFGQWLANGWTMVGQWLANGWPNVGQWLANGWQMVGQWLANALPSDHAHSHGSSLDVCTCSENVCRLQTSSMVRVSRMKGQNLKGGKNHKGGQGLSSRHRSSTMIFGTMYRSSCEKQRISMRKLSLLKICVLRYSSKFKGTFQIYVSTPMVVVLSSV